ncbi:MAG: 16S rRNA (cytidine(1402)-2'-O)-methyltransferase [Gammaproteobacteria bacterium]|nr:16S rRNA (cytidine(1402)-2'-O)-methyltransferase [Gammaproteobacteria bacterium]
MNDDNSPVTTKNQKIGVLYLVATPIGNLEDFSPRAADTLRRVGLVAAEDTRRTRVLMTRYGISTPTVSLHEHNETRVSEQLLERLAAGTSIAMVSDAGTPLINDPGLPLVRAARQFGVPIVPVPGPCAFIAALSASGLPIDRFAYEGFPPRSSSARRKRFEALRDDPRTLAFYESSHRVRETVADMRGVFEPERILVIARELTKLHETIVSLPLGGADEVFADPNMLKGEFVLLLEGAKAAGTPEDLTAEQERILRALLEECSVKTASALAARITGAPREAFYRKALQLSADREGPP